MKIKCSCSHKAQDELHGPTVRVANPVNKSRIRGELTEVRCSVCNVTHKSWSGPTVK